MGKPPRSVSFARYLIEAGHVRLLVTLGVLLLAVAGGSAYMIPQVLRESPRPLRLPTIAGTGRTVVQWSMASGLPPVLSVPRNDLGNTYIVTGACIGGGTMTIKETDLGESLQGTVRCDGTIRGGMAFPFQVTDSHKRTTAGEPGPFRIEAEFGDSTTAAEFFVGILG